ncbi:MAG: hypothetical protein MI717_07000 [Spirochaetales bacterium]|nr:hypothetical protein [Spirochaetales bacterium]
MKGGVWSVLLVMIVVFSPWEVFGQESLQPPLVGSYDTPARDPIVDSLLESALQAADQGEWEQALSILDQAERRSPQDERITSYRQSILELSALDQAQESWATGEAVAVPGSEGVENTVPTKDGDEETPQEPKFTIDRGEDEEKESPVVYRDLVRGTLSLHFLTQLPQNTEASFPLSSAWEFAYTALGADLRGWLPILGRSVGVMMSSSGFRRDMEGTQALYNSLDVGVDLRGFLIESPSSRLELGLDVGIGMLSILKNNAVQRQGAVFVGVWGRDPIFYHLLGTDFLEPFIIGGGLRVYSSLEPNEREVVNYRLEVQWEFPHVQTGFLFEWWNYAEDDGRKTVFSAGLMAGFRF